MFFSEIYLLELLLSIGIWNTNITIARHILPDGQKEIISLLDIRLAYHKPQKKSRSLRDSFISNLIFS